MEDAMAATAKFESDLEEEFWSWQILFKKPKKNPWQKKRQLSIDTSWLGLRYEDYEVSPSYKRNYD